MKRISENSIQFEATLLSIGNDTLELNNEKRTKYRVATISFVNAKDKVVQASAQIFEKSIAHGMTVGSKYLATADMVDTDAGAVVYLRVSHLPYAERASLEDFDFDVAFETATTTSRTVPATQPTLG